MLLTSSELLVLVVGSKLLMIESCKSKSEKAVWACFWLGLSPASVHPIEKKRHISTCSTICFSSS